MLAAKLVPPFFAFAVHVGVARLAGPQMLGEYVHLLAVLMIFQAVAGAGMQFLVTREVAADPEGARGLVRQARSFALASGAAASCLYLLYAWALLPPPARRPALALALTLLPTAGIALQEAVLVATRRHHLVAVIAVAENSIKLAAALAALSSGLGLLGVCAGIAAARLAALATGGFFVGRAGLGGGWRLDAGATAAFARAVAPFTALYVVSMTYFRVDVPIVAALAGSEATGFYGAAATLFGALLLLPEAALSAAYPRLAAACRATHEGYGEVTWLVAKVLVVGLVPVTLALIALADVVVAAAYGPGFAPSVPVLRLLALSLPVHALNGALGQALQAGGAQRPMVAVVTLGLAAHVALNVALVRAFGIAGAPVATLLSASGVAALTLLALHRRVAPVRLDRRALGRLLPIAGPLALATLAPAGLRPVAVLLGVAWLAAGSLWHGTFGPADLERLRGALRGRTAGVAA
jgi:O-antigen/teichoic acid export membrane protein